MCWGGVQCHTKLLPEHWGCQEPDPELCRRAEHRGHAASPKQWVQTQHLTTRGLPHTHCVAAIPSKVHQKPPWEAHSERCPKLLLPCAVQPEKLACSLGWPLPTALQPPVLWGRLRPLPCRNWLRTAHRLLWCCSVPRGTESRPPLQARLPERCPGAPKPHSPASLELPMATMCLPLALGDITRR